MRRQGEQGYALVAAVASIAVFATMALAVLGATRTVTADAAAEQAQLQAGAAADAGVATAIGKLLPSGVTERWQPDGRRHDLRFADARLAIRIEDERGKVPINGVGEEVATRLLAAVGLEGDRLLIARDSLLDWQDNDDDARPFGAERTSYAAAGVVPANGFLDTIDELGLVRGFDRETVRRLKAIGSTFSPAGAFDPRYASPDALAVMDGPGSAATAAIDRARELAGQRTAIAFADTPDLKGRSLTITVDARLADGARATRTAVVQLTGVRDAPYVVIASE